MLSQRQEHNQDRWLILALLTFARVTMGLQFQSVGAVAPLLMEHLHVANAQIGLLVGLFSMPGIVLALPGGVLGQRFGDRRVVVVGLALMCAGSAILGGASSLSAAIAGRCLSAVGAILLNVLLTR